MNNHEASPPPPVKEKTSVSPSVTTSGKRPLIIGAAIALALIAGWIIFRPKTAPMTTAAATKPAVAPDSIIVLDSIAQRLAAIQLETVGTGGGDSLIANGTITYDANRVSVVASNVSGRLVTVRADLGQSVTAGALLATVESPEVGAIRGDLERARSIVEIAQRNYDREKRLYEQQITPQRELLDAEATLRTAEADFRSATARLSAIGATDAGGGHGATFGLAAPIAGVVVDRTASPGQSVGPSTSLFTIADLRNVWINVDVYERDLSRIRTGAAASVSPSAFSTEQLAGRVTYAGGVVDTASRTFKVRVEVANSNLRLRPGMFAQVRIAAARGATVGAQISVPEIAVQDVNGKQVVFVATPTAGQFVARAVNVGDRSAGRVVITNGLRAGDRIVVNGAFQLKAELMKASFGDGE